MIENTIAHEIFISYRRNGGDILAKLLYETLRNKKYSVFFDHESLSAGVFGKKILSTIKQAKDVIIVLTKDCLERCKSRDDWMFLEINEAIKNGKNITLVFQKLSTCLPQTNCLSIPKKYRKCSHIKDT